MEDTTQNTYQDLAVLLAPYDRTALPALAGALSLMPENASHLVRLGRLTQAAMLAPPGPGTAPIGLRVLRRLLNAGPLASDQSVQQELAMDNMFTEEFAFYGGSYIVLNGTHDEALFILRHLVYACPGSRGHPNGGHATRLPQAIR